MNRLSSTHFGVVVGQLDHHKFKLFSNDDGKLLLEGTIHSKANSIALSATKAAIPTDSGLTIFQIASGERKDFPSKHNLLDFVFETGKKSKRGFSVSQQEVQEWLLEKGVPKRYPTIV
jgi:hypothetical protein